MGIRRSVSSLIRVGRAESCIRDDEEVVFFPTVGDFAEGVWRVPVHGWIYRRADLSRLRWAGLWFVKRVLRGWVGADEVAKVFLHQRAGAFLADNERWQRLKVRFGERVVNLRRSGANGHFRGMLEVPAGEVGEVGRAAKWVTYRAVTREGDGRVFEGRAMLLGAEGVSVISDIDDTIKVTEVKARRKMLRNTFLREFACVPEMAELYRRWERERGAAFHYVSASPWHLYPFLSEFLGEQGFPAGTFHLRLFRLMPLGLRQSLRPAPRVKIKHARELMRWFPGRRFVLVGDSGESDAGMYAKLWREFPGQVERIWIRNVTGEDAGAVRWAKVFREIPRARWVVFERGESILALA